VINQVVVAGTLVQDPCRSEAGFPAAEMRLALQHHPRFEGGAPTRHSEVLVRVFGEKRADVVMRWLAKGRPVMVSGHLEREGIDLVVVADRFEFMSDGTTSWSLASPPADARPIGRRTAEVAAA
jgi:single-stranded DNA-binding protein